MVNYIRNFFGYIKDTYSKHKKNFTAGLTGMTIGLVLTFGSHIHPYTGSYYRISNIRNQISTINQSREELSGYLNPDNPILSNLDEAAEELQEWACQYKSVFLEKEAEKIRNSMKNNPRMKYAMYGGPVLFILSALYSMSAWKEEKERSLKKSAE